MTDDELVEVYIVDRGWEHETEHMDEEEYAFYKEVLIDTLGFSTFRLRVAVFNLIDEVKKDIRDILTRRE